MTGNPCQSLLQVEAWQVQPSPIITNLWQSLLQAEAWQVQPSPIITNLWQSLLQVDAWQGLLGTLWEPRLVAYSPCFVTPRSGWPRATSSELFIGQCGCGAELLDHGVWPVRPTLDWQHGCL